jgi:hypothetical protein
VPYRPDGDFLEDDPLSARWEEAPEREGGAWWKWAVALASLLIFGGVVWYAYSAGGVGPVGPVRTVEAEPGPYKVRPTNPGGEVIPDQDKLVFGEAVGRPQETEDVLGPPPEAPQAKPEPVLVRPYTPPPPAQPPAQPAPAETPPAAAPPAAVPPVADASPTIGEAPPAMAPGASDGAGPIEDRPGQEGGPPAADLAELTTGEPPPWKAGEAAASPPDPAPPAPGAPMVQLGAYASEAKAMQSWEQVRREHEVVIGAVEPRVVKVAIAGKGDFYRLLIGPYADRGHAVETCVQLKARGRDCIVHAN